MDTIDNQMSPNGNRNKLYKLLSKSKALFECRKTIDLRIEQANAVLVGVRRVVVGVGRAPVSALSDEVTEEVDGQRKNNGRVLFGRNRVQRL